MNYLVRQYEEDDWMQLSEFIDAQWSRNHVILHKPLFDWQFRGFGCEDKEIRSLVLFDNDRIIGFRGIIPGLYQVPLPDGTMRISHGGAFAMWIVHTDYRGEKLGLKLHLVAQDILPVITGAGSTLTTSVPIYLENGFRMLGSMHRYVIPLIAEGYKHLLVNDAQLNDVVAWRNMCRIKGNPIGPCDIDLSALEVLWKQVTFPLQLFSLYRNEEFWRWRYRDNIGFRYLMFGDPAGPGVVVARIETADAEDDTSKQVKVLRIIEIVPKNLQAWAYDGEENVECLLSGVLMWAQNEGCEVADFFSSNTRFSGFLTNIGFKKQPCGENAYREAHAMPQGVLSLAPIFSPFRTVAESINALYRIYLPMHGFIRPDFESTYMVKSENDMDRPNKI